MKKNEKQKTGKEKIAELEERIRLLGLEDATSKTMPVAAPPQGPAFVLAPSEMSDQSLAMKELKTKIDAKCRIIDNLKKVDPEDETIPLMEKQVEAMRQKMEVSQPVHQRLTEVEARLALRIKRRAQLKKQCEKLFAEVELLNR